MQGLAYVESMVCCTLLDAVVGVQRSVQAGLAGVHVVCLIDLLCGHVAVDLIFVRLAILIDFDLSSLALV